MTIISKIRGQKDEDQFTKLRSSSLESSSSNYNDSEVGRVLRMSEDSQGVDRRQSSPYVLDKNGILTASLTIPVQTANQAMALNLEDDIPYIEDGSGHNRDDGRQQITVGLMRTPAAPMRRRQRSISGSDSSAASNIHQAITGSISLIQQGYDSAVGSSVTFSSTVQNTPSSVSSSIADAGMYSSPPSWASTPPTSPDSVHTSVNYIPDDNNALLTKATLPANLQKSPSGITSKDLPTLQKVSFTSASELRQVKKPEIKTVQKEAQRAIAIVPDTPRSVTTWNSGHEQREQKFTPSITNIGNAVLRSKTADFERIAKTDKVKPSAPSNSVSSSSDKKKYTKRRYTDSRHQTRHIPDAETLESASGAQLKKEPISQAVYKRRELISSVPSK